MKRDYKLELNKQKEILESQGYKVAYICLYGSQNYGLELFTDEYQSDIDMKAVIVPTLGDLIHNSKPISTTIETEWGQCDLKDIRIFFDRGILKANPVYVETLYTEYYIIDDLFKDEFNHIRDNAGQLVYCLQNQMIRAMYGMMMEKKKALCHPYPTIKHKIDKFGADFKQSHHIYRMLIMMNNYYSKKMDFKDCLVKFDKVQFKLLNDMKMSEVVLEDIILLVNEWMEEAKELKEFVISNIDESKIDYTIKNKMLDLSRKIIKSKITEEIKNG